MVGFHFHLAFNQLGFTGGTNARATGVGRVDFMIQSGLQKTGITFNLNATGFTANCDATGNSRLCSGLAFGPLFGTARLSACEQFKADLAFVQTMDFQRF